MRKHEKESLLCYIDYPLSDEQTNQSSKLPTFAVDLKFTLTSSRLRIGLETISLDEIDAKFTALEGPKDMEQLESIDGQEEMSINLRSR